MEVRETLAGRSPRATGQNYIQGDGVMTHLEPDILEWEVKWASGSITTNKSSGGDGTPVSYFKS